ncbi:membrane protein insertion efficiency factor YidD [Sphingobacteriales bacterium UPWRP_1]|nr:membrane protein insertion efficiency factor YidD [Sphingobacteriales bacterium UPWRP_1]
MKPCSCAYLYTLIWLWCVLFSAHTAQAQNRQADLALLQMVMPGQPFSPPVLTNNKKAMKTRNRSAFARYNPITLALTGSMFLYQNVLSAQMGRQCLYNPSCSNFSKQAIAEFGLVKGVFLTADRLLRCNRISALDLNLLNLNPKTGRFNDLARQYRLHYHEQR